MRNNEHQDKANEYFSVELRFKNSDEFIVIGSIPKSEYGDLKHAWETKTDWSTLGWAHDTRSTKAMIDMSTVSVIKFL